MNAKRASKCQQILLVEDSPTDVMMTREVLAQIKTPNDLHVVEDGTQALAFLRHEGAYADVPRPDLILLDLKLPKKSGQEVLAEIKTDADLMVIPVVVLTSSREQEDILNAYKLHANCYVSKPVGYAEFAEAVRTIEKFWCGTASVAEAE